MSFDLLYFAYSLFGVFLENNHYCDFFLHCITSLSLSLSLKLIPNLYKYKSIKNIAIIQLQKLFIQGFPWLGLCVSITEDMSLISGWGTKIPHAVQCSQKKKKITHWESALFHLCFHPLLLQLPCQIIYIQVPDIMLQDFLVYCGKWSSQSLPWLCLSGQGCSLQDHKMKTRS